MLSSPNTFLITGSMLIVDPDMEPLCPGGIAVTDGVIVAVGRLADLEHSWGHAKRLDLKGHTILAGLVDAHVHLCYGGTEERAESPQGEDEEDIAEAMIGRARELLEAGVTTARDLGSPGQLGVRVRDMLVAGRAVAPRLLVANAPLTIPTGHAWQHGGVCQDIGDLCQRVRERYDEGADLVKIMVTGGGTTPGSDPARLQFGLPEVHAVVEEAASLEMPVAAHAHGTEGIAVSLEAGVSTIEHCTWMGEGRTIGGAWDPALVEELARQGTPVCPTASALWDRMPAARRQAKIDTVHRMYGAGVRLVAGTDAGVKGVRHGDYVTGLLALRECGLSAAEVLGAATKVAATALGIGSSVGTLELTKAADVIAVEGNPLKDVGSLRDIRWVMRSGQVVYRATDST